MGLVAFVCGMLTPIGAVIVKPMNYSFYVFMPARPPDALDRARLAAADVMLVAGTLVCAAASLALAIQGARSGRLGYMALPMLVLLNPFQQPVFFERLDTYLNFRWLERVEAQGIIGKSPEEVSDLLGTPSLVWSEPARDDGSGGVRPGYTTWEYKPLPFYWFGSKGQVFFVNGRVDGVEGNDD